MGRPPAKPAPAAAGTAAIYELRGWHPDQVKELVAALKAEGIPFAWDERDALHVSWNHEATVNALIKHLG